MTLLTVLPAGKLGSWVRLPTRTPGKILTSPGVGMFCAEQQPQQGAFARAVAPHQADAVAGIDLQRHAGQDRLSAVVFLNVFK